MKKILSLLLLFISVVSLFAQPATEESKEKTVVRVASLKGPTAMGLVKLMEDAAITPDALINSYEFTIESAPDMIVPLIAKNDVDIASIPANLASVIYNNTGKIKVIAVNTLGVLYLVGDKSLSINSVEDIKGKTIYSAGKGSTPQYALEAILKGYNLEDGKDCYIEWKSEHSECVVALKNDKNALALLPQPFATAALMQNDNLYLCADLNELWKDLTGVPLITGCTVVTTSFLENNKSAVDSFLSEYKKSATWVNSNIDEASLLIEKNDIIKAQVAKKAIDKCNIVVWTGEEMKKSLSIYLDALYNENPKSVGGSIPGEEFYY